MAFSVSPSVIVREVDASASVPAIATPPAALAGVFRWGPVNETILISSENELANRFGKPTESNYETFFVAADYLSYSNALWVVRADNGTTKADGSIRDANNDVVDAGAFEALYPGELGNSIDVSYVEASNFSAEIAAIGQALNSVTRAPFGGAPAVIAEFSIDYNASNTTFEVLENERITEVVQVGDVLVIGNDSVGYQEIGVTSFTETGIDQFGAETSDPALTTHYEYKIGFATPYRLFESDVSKLSFVRKWRHASLVGNKAPSTNNYHIVVLDRTGDITGESNTVLETYLDVSISPSASLPDGTTNYYADVIENRSSWIAVADTTAFENATTKLENLAGGTDGSSEGVVPVSALAESYDFFASSNEIDVSFILQGRGDQAGILANYLISNIAESRKDVVAFLSPSKADVVDENKTNTKLSNVIAYRNKLQNSSYWFMDSGYKYRYDKYNDKYRWVPLNGDMAGLASRVEPFESPAGFRKGVIKNVIKLAFNPNKAQRDQLYSSDVNPVMSQVGQGVVLFGDKTGLGLPSAFDRINVRRLFISVEKAIANAAQSFLFELNDEFTQTQFKNIVEPFLREIQGRRGIIDFRVISDTTVNTPTIVDQGKFRANIFIKPARSINVIELTFVATRSGIEFEEIVGSLS